MVAVSSLHLHSKCYKDVANISTTSRACRLVNDTTNVRAERKSLASSIGGCYEEVASVRCVHHDVMKMLQGNCFHGIWA